MGHMSGMNNVHNPSMVPFGLIPADQLHMSSNPNDQAQHLSRSSSNSEERRNGPAPILNPSSQQQYNGVPTSMAQQMAPQMANYSMPQNQNGVPMFNGQANGQQQQSNLDWQAMFGKKRSSPIPNVPSYVFSCILTPSVHRPQGPVNAPAITAGRFCCLLDRVTLDCSS